MNAWARSSLALAAALTLVPALNVVPVAISGRPSAVCAWLSTALAALVSYRFVRPAARVSKTTLGNLWPLLLMLALYLGVTIVLFSAYSALPDVDPYHWVKIYTREFLSRTTLTDLHRPLFHSLIFLADTVLPLNPEEVLKFFIPLLSATVFVPLWLVARELPRRPHQLALLAFPFFSPSLLLSLQMGTPQALLLILATFFVCFLLHSYQTRDTRWHYAAGCLISIAVLYHGAALILLASWLAATGLTSRWRYAALLILALAAALGLPYVLTYLPQALQDVRPNLSFPAFFITIDGEVNGWPGAGNSMRYYAFYAGLVLPLLLISSIGQLKKMLRNPSLLALGLTLGALLTLAELLPRFFNIVFLPERALLLATVVSPVLVLLVARSRTGSHPWFVGILLCLASLNAFGALYVNQQKKYLLPDYAVISARWINTTLPADAIIFSNHGPDYLDAYLQQEIRRLPPDFFCQPEAPALASTDNRPAYLYFYPDHPRNPYKDRPWQDHESRCTSAAAIQKQSDRFREIYNYQQAVIWEIH